MMTLAELNAALQGEQYVSRRPDGWAYQREYAVGSNGRAYRGATGDKLHLLRLQRVIEKPADARPGTFKIGELASIQSCASNGQFTGRPIDGAELSQVTCSRCLKRLQLLRDAHETKGASDAV